MKCNKGMYTCVEFFCFVLSCFAFLLAPHRKTQTFKFRFRAIHSESNIPNALWDFILKYARCLVPNFSKKSAPLLNIPRKRRIYRFRLDLPCCRDKTLEEVVVFKNLRVLFVFLKKCRLHVTKNLF